MNGWSPSPRRRVTLRSGDYGSAGAMIELVLVLLVLVALRLLVMRFA